MLSLETLKRFAALDPDADDTVIQLCMDAAIKWFEDAGVPSGTVAKTYELGVYRLASHFYDNRGNTDQAADLVPPTVFSVIHQLRNAPALTDGGGAP